MTVISRHVRHDWRTFNDYHGQARVTTLCGTKTVVSHAGIPGVTSQTPTVTKNDAEYWGWCTGCIDTLWAESSKDDLSSAPEEIKKLYVTMRTEIFPQKMRQARSPLITHTGS